MRRLSSTITFDCPMQMRQELERVARQKYVSISDIVRAAIREYLVRCARPEMEPDARLEEEYEARTDIGSND